MRTWGERGRRHMQGPGPFWVSVRTVGGTSRPGGLQEGQVSIWAGPAHMAGHMLCRAPPHEAHLSTTACCPLLLPRFLQVVKARLQELGPRFTLRLVSLQKGTFDSKGGEFEWVHKPEMDTSRRKFHL